MEARGRFIVLEGPDSTAVTAQLEELADRMRTIGLAVHTFNGADSDTDKTSQAISSLARSANYSKTKRAKLLLASAAGGQLQQVIAGELVRGINCLVSHSFLAELVHHFYGLGDEKDYYGLSGLLDFAASGLTPDLTIILDAPSEDQSKSASTADLALAERLRAGYLWEAKQRGYPVVYITDGSRRTSNKIWKLVSQVFGQELSKLKFAESTPAPVKNSGSSAKDRPVLTISDLLATKINTISPAAVSNNLPESESEPTGSTYFTPPELKPPLKRKYVQAMDQIFAAFTEMLEPLADFIKDQNKSPSPAVTRRDDSRPRARFWLQAVLPVAAQTSVNLPLAGRDSESLSMWLASDELPEAKVLAKQIAAKPSTKTTTKRPYEKLRKLAEEYLPPSHADAAESEARLTDVTPRNELDIIPEILYGFSDENLDILRNLAGNWGYAKKANILKTYLAGASAEGTFAALSQIGYSWDVVCDYGIFRDLTTRLAGVNFVWQASTPRYGFSIPKVVEDAGLADKFENCFGLSLKLFSELQAAGQPILAQYATLTGHRLRFKMTLSAHEVFALLNGPKEQYPGTNQLLAQLRDQIAEVHPLLADNLA